MNEADTCRKYITPKLHAAGWDDDQIREQVTFTDGRIVPSGRQAVRKEQCRADYILRYTADYPIAVVEAKAENQSNWVNPSTRKQIDPIDCYMAVTQTYSGLQMRLMTPESDSWFVADRIRPSQKGEGYEIIGVYTNQPRINLRGDRSQIHFGAVVLSTHGAHHDYPDTLTGEYWTERGTKGNLVCNQRVMKVYSRYEDAKHATRSGTRRRS